MGVRGEIMGKERSGRGKEGGECEGDMRCKKPWQRAYLLCEISSRMRLRAVV